jgi:hypothetical protein
MFDKTYEIQPAFWGTPNAEGLFTCPDFDDFEHVVMLLAVHSSAIKMTMLPLLIHIIALGIMSFKMRYWKND